jgi:hypothetical protein
MVMQNLQGKTPPTLPQKNKYRLECYVTDHSGYDTPQTLDVPKTWEFQIIFNLQQRSLPQR